ncbi:E-selectin-like [Saccostrea echinata]|uniref:E-selectin-like n=1 Tax=Saccostrea echinata TaxID=191078 RepID=UPI002A7FF494|nr:E-selectin-like [Saccostrea echinata]
MTFDYTEITCDKHDSKLEVKNGAVSCNAYTYESQCHAECKQGYTLSPGINSVTCQADKSWSSKLPDCKEISCGWPILPDRYMNVDCPNGLSSGVECHINCGNFKVVGNTTIHCERKGQTTVRGEWNYGQKKPYCKKNPCEPLPAPTNGAIACDAWIYGLFCQMQCMDGYDIPHGAVGTGGKAFSGRYVCSETKGTFIPSNIVPNCTVKRLPSESKTLMNFYYYTGDCNNITVQEEIRTNFITNIRDMQDNGGFDGICPNEISCNIANVSVSCGEISSRRRRVLRTAALI